MTKIRTSQLDPGLGVDGQFLGIVSGKIVPTDLPVDSDPGGGGGIAMVWHQAGYDVVVPGGSFGTDPSYNADPDSIMVFVNGLFLERDVDWTYTPAPAPPPPPPIVVEYDTIAIPGTVVGDRVVIRYQGTT